jgi:hypothetical protein
VLAGTLHAPKEDDGRRHFDAAVQAEADERDALRADSCRDGDDAFEDVVGKRRP